MSQRLIVMSVFLLTIVVSGRGESELYDNTKVTKLKQSLPYKEGSLLVRWKKPSTSSPAMHAMHFQLQAKVLQTFQKPHGLQLVELPEGISTEKAMTLYKNNPYVAYVEPDYYVHTQATINDSKYLEQWALNNTGQTEGKVDADVNAPEMWEITKGSKDIVVGIIDTGVFYTHPDLAGNIWVNPGEIAGNGIDDDGNGYIDDVHGINAIKQNGDPLDDNSHGTHVAGIIGAVGDNEEGISGINQKVSIVGCKFLDAGGGGKTSDALLCMDYLLKLKTREKDPVNIVASNNSWAGGMFSQAMFDAIKAHKEAGILFVAAASNEGNDNDVVGTFPADYPLSNIISVAASNDKDELASFSNYGVHSVHVAAPGEKILSTVLNGEYNAYSGTSMAAPHVAGMAALIKSFDPTLDWISIKNLLISSGDPIEAAKDKIISGRRLRGAGESGAGALTCQDQFVAAVLSPQKKSLMIKVGEKVDFKILNINCANAVNLPVLETNIDGLDLKDDGKENDGTAGDGIFSTTWLPEESGNFRFSLDTDNIIEATVYNPASWLDYESEVEAELDYRVIEGEKLKMRDDSVAQIELPFSVKFAGDKGGFKKVYVSSNGTLSFTETGVSSWKNVALPVSSKQSLLAPFWDDLNPASVGGVYYQVLGEAPNRELVVEWRDVQHFTAGDTVTFEVVLFEYSSDVVFKYLDVDLKDEAYSGGASATVGIQTHGDRALKVGFNEAVVQDKTSIRFYVTQPVEEDETDETYVPDERDVLEGDAG